MEYCSFVLRTGNTYINSLDWFNGGHLQDTHIEMMGKTSQFPTKILPSTIFKPFIDTPIKSHEIPCEIPWIF